MAELLIKIDSDALVEEIQRRAAERGVTPDEEVRRVLNVLVRPPKPLPAAPEKEYTLFDHIRKLGEIAPDFEFERVRRRSDRPVEF